MNEDFVEEISDEIDEEFIEILTDDEQESTEGGATACNQMIFQYDHLIKCRFISNPIGATMVRRGNKQLTIKRGSRPGKVVFESTWKAPKDGSIHTTRVTVVFYMQASM